MDLIKKYHLVDFKQSRYYEVLKLAKKEYGFCSFADFKKSKKSIILRHDIDASVPAALEIAEIEKSLKIKATYFILLHSPWYNLLEDEQTEAVKNIVKAGHYIGLHFDAGFYNIKSENELVKFLKIEKDFLQKTFNVNINTFAFHNPDSKCLKFDKWKYAGMINTYSRFFKENIAYVSDSNGYWRNSRLIDEIKSGNHNIIQVLTHPLHWQKSTGYPKHKVWKYLSESADIKMKGYDALLKHYKRKNIGELSDLFGSIRKLNKQEIFRIEKSWITGDYISVFLQTWILFHSFTGKISRKKGLTLSNLLNKSGIKLNEYKKFSVLKDKLLSGNISLKPEEAKKAVTFFLKIINENRKTGNND